MSDELLRVTDLRTVFRTEEGVITPVNDVSFSIQEGETLGLVGESGAGKSVTARSILRLIDSPGEIVGGNVIFEGRDLLQLSNREMRSIRGNRIAMIMQDPLNALNPVLTVGEQIAETIVEHQDTSKQEAKEHAVSIMRDVDIPDAEDRLTDYPHEFSGGMRQRVLIAIALSCEPDLIIADEPTTALDVTTQAEVLALMDDLQRDKNLSMLWITHDLSVVAQICDRVGVMYAGNLVERADVHDLFEHPRHPYSRSLLDSIPDLFRNVELVSLPGTMPDLHRLPSGCNFAERCPYAKERCRQGDDPSLKRAADASSDVACIRADELMLDRPTASSESSTTSTSEQNTMDQSKDD